MMNDAKLCYCTEHFAWFTTQALEDQWGDDWDDAPWEHNSGEPYYPREGENFAIVKLAWEGNYELPGSRSINSPYSVKMINAGNVPWLWDPHGPGKPIFAGTSVEDFIAAVLAAGGEVYVPK